VAFLMPGLGVFGTLLTSRKRKPVTRKSIRWMSLLGLTLAISLFALGCGGSSNNSNKPTTPASQQATVMVTGTSGTLTNSSAVMVTIN
jgi:hypothetical protein